jgi:N-methylhydantoinase B/oxoprolinase/acetone carboxylase alpha subunit
MTEKVDPVTISVIRGSLISLCTEIGVAMERTAYSTILSEGQDFSVAVYDKDSELVAQAAFDPSHLGAMAFAVGSAIKEIGKENLREGDVLLNNDPFRGGTHLHDFTVIKPIFWRDAIVAIPAVRAHQIDVGGMAAGGNAGEATDIFQEGIRFPPTKIISEGREVTDVWKLWLSNVRLPKAIHGDMRSLLAAVDIADKRIIELIKKYGLETFQESATQIKNISESMMRNEISKLPKKRAYFEDFMDDTGTSSEKVRVCVTITINGNDLIADYTGSSPQTQSPINATYAVTAASTYIAVLQMLSQDWLGVPPINQGMFRPIKIIAPPGSFVNADHPSAVFGGNVEVSMRLIDTMLGALIQLVPVAKTKAACYSTNQGLACGGKNPDGKPYVWYLYREGGWGANAASDGKSALFCNSSNCKNQPVEIFEARYPWLYEHFSLNEDSGGPGKYRGGLGTIMLMRLLAPEAELNGCADRFTNSPFGIFDGLPPKPTECGHWSDFRVRLMDSKNWKHVTELFDKPSPSKWSRVTLHKGDVIEHITTGGGGFGNPLERDHSLVEKDIIDGYVTIESARRFYGLKRRQRITSERS